MGSLRLTGGRPSPVAGMSGISKRIRRTQSPGDQEWSPSQRIGIAAAEGALSPQRAEEIHQLHLFGCLAPCLQQKRGAYDDGERFRS